MKKNILSLDQLMKTGSTITKKDGFHKLRDFNDNVIAKVPMTKNHMFILKILNDVAKCLKACVGDYSWLWHLRLGHLNFKALNFLSKKYMVNGLPHIKYPNQICEGHLFKRQSRRSFPKESMTRAREPLEILFTLMYVGLLILHLFVRIDISYYSSTILAARHGCTFSKRSLKFLNALKSSNPS